MKSHVVDRPTVVLFDGDCSLCAAGIDWLRARVAPGRVVAMPFTAASDDPRLSQLVDGRDLAGSLHAVLPDDRVVSGAAAVLAAGREVRGWRWLARLYDHRPGHALLEPAYRLVAANRGRIGRALGVERACAVPGAGPAAG